MNTSDLNPQGNPQGNVIVIGSITGSFSVFGNAIKYYCCIDYIRIVLPNSMLATMQYSAIGLRSNEDIVSSVNGVSSAVKNAFINGQFVIG